MSAADFLPFLDALGWLAAFGLAALLPSLPAFPGRRHAGWLVAFCASRLLLEAQALAFPAAEGSSARAGDWRHLAAILSASALWEFARRVHNEHARRRIAAATHLIAAEAMALLLAVRAPFDAAAPDWFAPIELAAWFLPAALGAAAAIVLWRGFSSRPATQPSWPLRAAAVGLGAHYSLPAIPGLALLAPLPAWIVVGGFGTVVLALPAARSRFSLWFGAGLLLMIVLGPLAVAMGLATVGAQERHDLLARAERAAVMFPRTLVARIDAQPQDNDAARALGALLERIRASDPLVRSVELWRLQDGQRANLLQPLAAPPVATPAERNGVLAPREFIVPATAQRELITVHVPLRVSAAHSPAAWLALDYPDAFWAAQRRAARRNGIAVVGLLAAFCAIGFVLACRQAIENAHRIEIERAQSASQAKTEFLAFLSHEMRTPLQTILGRTELLRTSPHAVDDARRHAAAIETQGRLLLRLVTDLLDLGTLEAGKFQLRSHPFSLRQTLAAVDDTLRATAAAKQLALELILAPNVPNALVGDEARLRQILGNLLGNALKYTTRGRVALEISLASPSVDPSATEARVRFQISDTGPGLPPEKIDQLFTLFTRLDAGDTFTREGTGVGLALVRRLCLLMGGTVTARNRPEGGAEFTAELAFPLDLSGLPATTTTEAAPSAPGRRVLIAEDNTAAREFLAEALRILGHEVVAVAEGDAALTAATSGEFHTAFLDVNLPQRDGIAITCAVRQRNSPLRIIGCSAEAGEAVRDAALAAGMDDYLVKPVTLDDLRRVLTRHDTPAPPAADNIFAQLQSPAAQARTRAVLQREWRGLHEATCAAIAAGELSACGRCAHFVQSSALMLGDQTLLEQCRRLSRAAEGGDAAVACETLAAMDAHLREQPGTDREGHAVVTTTGAQAAAARP